MSDSNTEETPEVDEVVEPQGDPAATSTIASLEDALKVIGKLRTEAGNKRLKNKELEAKAAEYDKYLDSQKSELERLTDEATKTKEENRQLKLDKLRADVALKAELDPELAVFLVGETVDELNAQAKVLNERLGKGKKITPDFFAGQRGGKVTPPEDDANAWFAQAWKDAETTKRF